MPLNRRASIAVVLVFAAVAAMTVVARPQQRDPKQYQQTLERAERVAALQVDRVITTLGITAGMTVLATGINGAFGNAATSLNNVGGS